MLRWPLAAGGGGNCCAGVRKMGARLSAQQKIVFYQVVGTLEGGSKRFSRERVKQFVRWLFLHFPNFTPDRANTVEFWNEVGTKLTELVNEGDTSADKFVTLFILIQSAVIEEKKMQEQPPQTAPVSPVSPSPCSSPPNPELRETCGATCRASCPVQGSPKGNRIPGSPRLSQNPCPGSPGQATRALSHSPVSPVVNPQLNVSQVASPQFSPSDPRASVSPGFQCSPMFPYPSPNPQNGSRRAQDGRDHMARTFPCTSSPHNPFQTPMNNPFLPSSTLSPYPNSTQFPSKTSSSPGAGPSEVMHLNPAFSNCRSSSLPSSSVGPPVPPLPAPGSHALSSGSHGPTPSSHALGTGGSKPGSQNPEQVEIPLAAPVTFLRRGGRSREWEALSFQTKRELCKAQKEFGRGSKYFKGLLKATFSANEMVPSDLKELFSCLLSTADFRLWKQGWKRSLETILPSLLHSSDGYIDGVPLTLDHLCGEGDWDKPEKQARVLPRPVLIKVMEAAEKVFNTLPEEGPQINLMSIFQLPNEPFNKFINRLQAQAERQVEEADLQERLVLEAAKANANDICKQIIFSLPLYPTPTLDILIEACSKKVPMMGMSRAIPPQQLRRAPTAAVTQFPPSPARQPLCFRCRQPGHLARDCPAGHPSQGSNEGARASNTIIQKN